MTIKHRLGMHKMVKTRRMFLAFWSHTLGELHISSMLSKKSHRSHLNTGWEVAFWKTPLTFLSAVGDSSQSQTSTLLVGHIWE